MKNHFLNITLRPTLDPTAIAAVSNKLKSQLGGIKIPVDLQVNPSAVKNLQSAAGSITSVGTNARKATQDMKGLASSINQSTGELEHFGAQVRLAGQRFLAFSAAAGAFFAVTKSITAATKEAIKFDLQLNRLQQVSGETKGAIREIGDEVMRLSSNLGASSSDLIEAAVTLKQAGLATKEVKTALESVAKASLAPNFSNMTQITEGTIAAFQQFGKDINNVKGQLGAMNAVAGDFAVEASDLVTVVQKAGGAFSQTGGNLNELLALFTSVRATTRESADSIATGLRTIFTRIQRGETIDSLKELGIQLRYTREEAGRLGDSQLENQFVGAYEGVRRLSEGLKELRSTDPRYAGVIEQLGGYRQISRVIPLIKEFSTAQQALNVARVGSASLDAAAITRQDALATKFAKVREEFQKLANTVVQSDGFQKLADIAAKVATSFAAILGFVTPLAPLLAGLAIGKGVASVGSLVGGFSNFRDNLKVTRRATGGPIPGYGGGDKVNARLEPGEFVVRKEAARSIGHGALGYMNSKGKVPPGYAKGGFFDTKDPKDNAIWMAIADYSSRKDLSGEVTEGLEKLYLSNRDAVDQTSVGDWLKTNAKIMSKKRSKTLGRGDTIRESDFKSEATIAANIGSADTGLQSLFGETEAESKKSFLNSIFNNANPELRGGLFKTIDRAKREGRDVFENPNKKTLPQAALREMHGLAGNLASEFPEQAKATQERVAEVFKQVHGKEFKAAPAAKKMAAAAAQPIVSAVQETIKELPKAISLEVLKNPIGLPLVPGSGSGGKSYPSLPNKQFSLSDVKYNTSGSGIYGFKYPELPSEESQRLKRVIQNRYSGATPYRIARSKEVEQTWRDEQAKSVSERNVSSMDTYRIDDNYIPQQSRRKRIVPGSGLLRIDNDYMALQNDNLYNPKKEKAPFKAPSMAGDKYWFDPQDSSGKANTSYEVDLERKLRAVDNAHQRTTYSKSVNENFHNSMDYREQALALIAAGKTSQFRGHQFFDAGSQSRLNAHNEQTANNGPPNKYAADSRVTSSVGSYDGLFAGYREAVNDYGRQKASKRGGSANPNFMSDKTVGEGIAQAKLEYDKELINTTAKQLRVLDSSITRQESLNLAKEIADKAYRDDAKVMRDSTGKVTGFKSVVEDLNNSGKKVKTGLSGWAEDLKGAASDRLAGKGKMLAGGLLLGALSFGADAINPTTDKLNSIDVKDRGLMEAERSRYINKSTLSSTLSYGAVGAAVGGQFGGLHGAVAGGIGGAIYGGIVGRSEGRRGANDAILTKEMENLNDLTKEGGNKGLSGINSEELLRSIKATQKAAAEAARLKNTSFFGTLDEGSYASSYKQEQKTSFSGSVGGMLNILSKEATNLVNKDIGAGRNTAPTVLAEQLSKNPIVKALLEKTAEIRDIPLGQALKELTQDIYTAQKNALAAQTVFSGQMATAKGQVSINRLAEIAGGSISSTANNSIGLNNIIARLGGGFGESGIGNGAGLSMLGRGNEGMFNQDLGGLASNYGSQGTSLYKRGRAVNSISNNIDSVLSATLGGDQDMQMEDGMKFRSIMEATLKEMKSPESRQEIERLRSILVQLQKEFENQGGLRTQFGRNPEVVMKKITEAFSGGLKENLQALNEPFEAFGKELNVDLGALMQLRQQFRGAIVSGSGINLESAKFNAGVNAEKNGIDRDSLLTLRDLMGPFLAEQGQLGGKFGSDNNVAGLIARFEKLPDEIAKAQQTVSGMQVGNAGYLGAQKNLKGLEDEQNNLRQALKNVADVSKSIGPMMERLQAVNNQYQGRSNYREGFYGSGVSDRLGASRRFGFARDLAQQQDPKAAFMAAGPGMQQQLIQALRELGDIKIFGDKTGNGLRQQIFGDDDPEKDKLIAGIREGFKNAANANDTLIKGLKTNNDDFLSGLDNKFTTFLKGMETNRIKSDISSVKTSIEATKIRLGEANEAAGNAGMLSKFGFNKDSFAKAQKSKSLASSFMDIGTELKSALTPEHELAAGLSDKNIFNKTYSNTILGPKISAIRDGANTGSMSPQELREATLNKLEQKMIESGRGTKETKDFINRTKAIGGNARALNEVDKEYTQKNKDIRTSGLDGVNWAQISKDPKTREKIEKMLGDTTNPFLAESVAKVTGEFKELEKQLNGLNGQLAGTNNPVVAPGGPAAPVPGLPAAPLPLMNVNPEPQFQQENLVPPANVKQAPVIQGEVSEFGVSAAEMEAALAGDKKGKRGNRLGANNEAVRDRKRFGYMNQFNNNQNSFEQAITRGVGDGEQGQARAAMASLGIQRQSFNANMKADFGQSLFNGGLKGNVAPQAINLDGLKDIFKPEKIQAAFGGFGENIDKLAKAMEGFPTEVAHTGTFKHEIIINGTDAANVVGDKVKEQMVAYVNEQINEQFKIRLPDAPRPVTGESLNGVA